ncbi:MAG TPA: ATP-binding protein [Candidatus Saccharimonadales bacterium]|nr:ATP-binding protein [Candidatus Saccharimonadales bacterium]
MNLINPLTKIKEIQRERDAKPKQHILSFGEQDPMDIISYAGMKEQPDHLIIDGQFRRTIFLSGYPFTAEVGWLDSLTHLNHDIDVSYHVEQADSNEALKKLEKKITQLESMKRARLRDGGIIGPEITDPLDSAMELRDAIRRGQQKLFHVSIYATLIADSLEELNDTTNSLKSSLSARLFYIKTAQYQQIEGLQSTLPRGENVLAQRRNLDSETAALTFPFVSSELVQPGGILYGVNNSNNSLVIIDRFSLHNANSITFAQSGSGKSYTTKVEILRQLMQGTRVIVIDPEREYQNLTSSVGGSYVKLSAQSDQKINPFDMATTSRSSGQLSSHAQDLTDVIALMVDGLNAPEKAALDKAILAVYSLKSKKPPILEDLYKQLKKVKEAELCKRLEKYITGSLANVFNHQTSINLENRLVVFDIKDLPESIRQIMMMIVANFVQNTVKLNPQKRMLVIDEGWMLLEHEETARFVAGLVRRARKYGLGVSIITQQANDFLSNKYGRAIASQSSLRILMRQDTTTIEQVTREFRLSDYEKSYLLTSDRGDALIIADQQHVSLHVTASEEEHPLITTNPLETLTRQDD